MHPGILRITILGSGSSGGVPRADGDWGVCDPSNPKNRRSRCSLLVERKRAGTPWGPETTTTILIDTSPDLRNQLLDAKVTRIDGLLYTHDHADQTHGIDDLRAIVYSMGKRIPTWMDAVTSASLTKKFGYIFETPKGSHYPSLLDAKPLPDHGEQFWVEGPGGAVGVVPLGQNHGPIDSLGFRIGDFGYCNDVRILPEQTLVALAGIQLFVVDALRWTPHPSHSHVSQTLSWIERLKPRLAVLTDMHIDIDYEDMRQKCPPGVEPGYDGWTLEIPENSQ
jgi:phosphoribosyl 1,2-cyclic phosphate phosphodiesterase